MSKHTPGPWWYSNHSNEIGTEPAMAIKVAGWIDGANPEEKKANAQLIAAAPELLEALVAAQRWIASKDGELTRVENECLRIATTAINKAEGN